MASALISRALIIVFGLLYPAYYSYKAIKTRNVTEYVKWMMYWIVFAIFYNVETIADLLISWLPMYYEMKVIFVIWLLSPATQGADVLYRMYIHPYVTQHEEEIEKTLEKVKSQSYTTLLSVGAQGVNLALQGAIAGQTKLADQLKKTYSKEDERDEVDNALMYDDVMHSSHSEACLNRSSSLREDKYGDDDRYHSSTSLVERNTESSLRHRHPRKEQQTMQSAYRKTHPNTHSSGVTRSDSTDRKTNKTSPLMSRKSRGPSQLSRGQIADDDQWNMSVQSARSLKTSKSTPGLSHTVRNKQPTEKHSPKSPHKHPTSPVNRANIAKPVTRPTRKVTETQAPQQTPELAAGEEDKPKSKPRFTESTLRYRTKKISDIKSHKIESPFISIF